MAAPVQVADARSRALRYLERDMREWLADGELVATFDLPLHPPSERAVLADSAAARRWVESWAKHEGVVWATRSWPSAGTQRVPERLVLRGAETVASFAGAESLRQWRAVTARVQRLMDGLDPSRENLGVRAAIRAHHRRILTASDLDIDRVVGVVQWLASNPVDGLRIRHVPLRGVDTKWLGSNRALVETLFRAVTGRDALGLLETPPLLRARMLDPALWPGGVADAAASTTEWATLHLTPSTVLIVENLETLLALSHYRGVVAVHGSGYGTAARVRGVPWIVDAPRILYWGDLDSHGFGILHELRSSIPQVVSVLMDERTLAAHRDLWVPEPTPTFGVFASLDRDEHAARSRIAAEGNVRLEQERIPWSYAEPIVRSAVEGIAWGGLSS